MNRIEFMTELASLLQDIPVEERKDAMQYYNDYFDDAGEEQEQQVIEELESPAKVAEKIKADMAGFREEETKPNMPATKEQTRQQGEQRQSQTGQQNYQQTPPPGQQSQTKSDRTLKIILIIALILLALPILLPLGAGLLCLALGIVISLFAVFLGLVIAAVVVVITGVALFISGLLCLVPDLAVGFALMGIRADPDRSGSSCVSGSGKTLCSSDSWHLPGNCVDLS